MPATDVPEDLLGEAGGFVQACRPRDLVYFTINVGDGDAALLLTPARSDGTRRCLVVDCIQRDKLFALIESLAALGVLQPTRPLLALVVATHPHEDHISGMPDLLERFGDDDVAELWEPGYFHTSGAYHEMMAELEDRPQIAHLQPTAGTVRFIDRVKLTVLAPGVSLRGRFDSYGVNINNASIALRIDFPAARVIQRGSDRTLVRPPTTQALILGADAQTLSWSQVLVDFPQLGPASTATARALRSAGGTQPLAAEVFKVPHHGSKHGLSLELVETIRPAVSIVSSGRSGGRYDFPHAVTQAALREAVNPVSSSPGTDHDEDHRLTVLYTGSYAIDQAGEDVRPLGSIGMLVGSGGRREIWRFGDDEAAEIDLSAGRPQSVS
ncbi:MAG TPA: hypothetical protein VGV40_06035 [Solirubrobacteraceae bacterium]|nr:hypothetical protein [Solirubrobacteraceae bacterium]